MKKYSGVALGCVLIVGSFLMIVDAVTMTVASAVPSAFMNVENMRFGWILPLGIAIVFSLAAMGIGSRINRGSLEEDFAVGCVALSFWPIILHSAGVLREEWIIVPVILAAPFGLGRGLFRRLKSTCATVWNARRDAGWFGAGMFIVGTVALAWAFGSTLAPPTGMDALTYHIGLGIQYLARGSLTPPDAVNYYQYTQAGEMIALIGVAFDRSGIAANIILGLAFPAAVMAACRAAGEIARDAAAPAPLSRALYGGAPSPAPSHACASDASATAKMIAFGVTSASAMILFTVSHTKTDTFTLLMFLLAVRRLLPASFSPWRAAFFLGASLAVKITAIYGVIPAVLILAWKTRTKKTFWLICLALLFLSPSYWWIRNIFQFGTIMPQSGHVVSSAAGAIMVPWIERIIRIFASFFLFIDQGIDGPMGAGIAAVTLASIASIRSRIESIRITSIIASAAIAIWFLSGGGSHAYARGGLFRFTLPALGAALIGGSASLAFWLEEAGRLGTRPYLPRIIKSGLCISAVVSFAVAARIHMQCQPFPAYLSGGIGMDEYMKNWSSSWRLQNDAAGMLPPEAKVLSFAEARLFYMGRNASFEFDADMPRIFIVMQNSPSSEDAAVVAHLAQWVKQEGYTHILYAPDWYAVKIMVDLAPTPPKERYRTLLEKYFRDHTTKVLEDTGNQVFLHEVR